MVKPQWLFLAAIFLFSCNQYEKQEIPKPDNFIAKPDFVQIMVDVRLVEAAVRVNSKTGAEPGELTKYYYADLFARYQITEKQFVDNLEYYSSIPEKMASINEEIVAKLVELESEVKAQKTVNEETE